MPAINNKQIIRYFIAAAIGVLATFCVDFFLTYNMTIDLRYPFSFIKITSVAAGSFISGMISKRYGWLTGAIIALIFFTFIAFTIFPTSPWKVNDSILIQSHQWTSILPTGLIMIVTGLLGGYFGSLLSQKIVNILRK